MFLKCKMVVQYLSLSGLDTGMSTIDMQKYDNHLDMKSRFIRQQIDYKGKKDWR